jgi:acetylcholinesterase
MYEPLPLSLLRPDEPSKPIADTFKLSSAFHIATRAQIEGLVNTYPMDPSAGSPFRTGSENEVYPQYKRIAALFGDLKFTLMRRFELASTRQIAPEVPWWSYLATYGYGTPTVGTQHGLDTLEIYLALPLPQPGETTMTYYISFVNHLDPNTITTASPLITWPPWTEGTPVLLNLSKDSNELIPDTFRQRSYEYLRDHWSVLRL